MVRTDATASMAPAAPRACPVTPLIDVRTGPGVPNTLLMASAAARCDEAGAVANGVRSGGTGRRHGLTGPSPAVAHRHHGRACVGHHHRNKKKRDAVRPLLLADHELILEGLDAADARAHDDAG